MCTVLHNIIQMLKYINEQVNNVIHFRKTIILVVVKFKNVVSKSETTALSELIVYGKPKTAV